MCTVHMAIFGKTRTHCKVEVRHPVSRLVWHLAYTPQVGRRLLRRLTSPCPGSVPPPRSGGLSGSGRADGRPTSKALMDQTVKDHDQALGIQDGLPDALQDLAKALARCSSECSFGTLNCALEFVARILEAIYKRLLANLEHIMRKSAMLVVCPLNKLTDLRGVSTVRAGIAVRRPVRPRASNRNIMGHTQRTVGGPRTAK